MDVAANVAMAPLVSLPGEIFHLIFRWLGISDVFALGMTCRRLRDVAWDDAISRAQFQSAVPFASELAHSHGAGDHGRSLRARVKRQHAIANLEPFAAAVVALADTYIYVNHMLVYVQDRVLRMLPLGPNATVRHETRVDVRALLDEAVLESKDTRRYIFRPLHYADGIVSCVYAHHRLGPNLPQGQENWLVCFNPETGWNISCPIPFPHHRLFVRNNKEHLVYGMYTARSRIAPASNSHAVGIAGEGSTASSSHHFEPVTEDGGMGNHRHWRVRHFDLVAKKWSAIDSSQLDDTLGLGEFGRDICFEIIDGFFYVVSNQQRFLDYHHEMAYMSTPHRDDYYINGHDGAGAGITEDYYTDDDTSQLSDAIVDSIYNSMDGSLNGSVDDRDAGGPETSDEEMGEGSEDDRHTDSDGEHLLASNEPSNGPTRTRASLFQTSSFFTCIRFPLSDGKPALEQPTLKSRWRRRHSEGALDDRWTTLKVQKSAETGGIVIVEQRKEWLNGSSNSRRTYYIQPLVWPSELRKKELEQETKRHETDETDERAGEEEEEDEQQQQHEDESSIPINSSEYGSTGSAKSRKRKPQLSDLQHTERVASAVHPGDDASLVDPLILSACYGRFYSLDASTFVDIVDQNTGGASGTQKLALRAGTRVLSHQPQTPEQLKHAQADTESHKNQSLYPIEDINSTYVARDVVTWPQRHTFCESSDAAALDAASDATFLGPVVNPPGYNGGVTAAAWDDRVLVYSTKTTHTTAAQPTAGKVHAIVVVSFDPTLCLPGLTAWADRRTEALENETSNEPTLVGVSGTSGEESTSDGGKKGSMDEAQLRPGQAVARWVSSTKPNYLAINNGYDLSYHTNK
ncbi:f-box domain containing protein [Ophiostoma piceae UAMH 11346]|uniref:F-box domain containing protein n=1 Tax=Ophiostoma piceae (strain UAMH 11346) TaxID=1262450 RepID=S3C9R7_OPHP1|nr:f-box domain containing protein [Ophiostoma piceae UAMH 11346]